MYILECSDGTYYTGSTIDLERRLAEHQGIHNDSGHGVGTGIELTNAAGTYRDDRGANYTQKRRPVKLVYYEEYDRIDEAFYREKQVQGWSHKKKQALIDGTPELLPQLAKKIFRKKTAKK